MSTIDKALLQYSQLSAMQEPDPFNVKNLKKWMRHDQEEQLEIDIGGSGEENTWGELYKSATGSFSRRPLWKRFLKFLWHRVWLQENSGNRLDLLVVQPPTKIGYLYRWTIEYFIPLWQEFRHRKDLKIRAIEEDIERNESIPSAIEEEGGGWLSTEWTRQDALFVSISNILVLIAEVFSMTLACLFPVVAVVVLAQLHQVKDLLGALAGFVVVLAVGLQVITGGEMRPADLFSATAVYVLVSSLRIFHMLTSSKLCCRTGGVHCSSSCSLRRRG